MITTVCLNTKTKEFTENCLSADISELRMEEGNVIWADVSDPTSRILKSWPKSLAFILSRLKTAATSTNGPKVEEYHRLLLHRAL